MKYLSLLACTLLLSGTAAAQTPTFAMAVQDHREGRWSSAYGRFIELASLGDTDAARIALFMHRNGPLLYGTHWDASQVDTQSWAQLAASPGRADPLFRPANWPVQTAPRAPARPTPPAQSVRFKPAGGSARSFNPAR
jgi:hypothetical protein